MDELTLDAAGPHKRESCLSPTATDLDRYFCVLKDRQAGTLYLFASEGHYLVVGVHGGIWLAHLYTGDSLWIANQQTWKDDFVDFNFANTATPIPAKFTCTEFDAAQALQAFLRQPDRELPGNWVSEYDESA